MLKLAVTCLSPELYIFILAHDNYAVTVSDNSVFPMLPHFDFVMEKNL